jgi:hypothetical protein
VLGKGTSGPDVNELWDLVVFPEHALLIVQERLREQQAEGLKMPDGMPLDELALRVLIAAEAGRVPDLGD